MTDDQRPHEPAAAYLTDHALRSAVDAAPDGLIVVDADGIMLFVNPMTETLFGYGRHQLIGHSVDMLVPEGLRRGHAARRAEYVDHPQTRPMGVGLELRGQRRSGAEFPVEISLSPVQSGDHTLVIAVVRDITERREAAEELARARADLALVDDRERIARDLHDTVIQRLFAVGLSLQGALTRGTADVALDRMQQAVDDIDDTIRDIRSSIFALSTRRPGGASLRDDVIAIVAEASRPLGFQPTVAFSGAIDSAATDAMKVQLVATLREALSNVARHADATRASVDVTVEGGSLLLRVSDNGVGIGTSHGTGNGLANMRERASTLRGQLDVRVGPAGGTQVVWRVPVDAMPAS